jgi:uncharacterized protein YxeA
MRKFLIFILIIVIIGAVMFFTNPFEENFSDFLERTSSRNIAKYASGTQDILDSQDASAKPTATDFASAKFTRKNYYVFSMFEIESPQSLNDYRYLGIFKIFIRMN